MMTIWYVRPDAAHGGTRNGTSYTTAWGGWSEIVWGGAGIIGGDTLYLCGVHTASAAVLFGVHGATSGNPFTLRGDYAPDPGSFTYTGGGNLNLTRNWTTVKNLTITGGTTSCVYVSIAEGFVIEGCEIIGGTSGIALNGAVAFLNARIVGNVIHGQTGTGGISCAIGTASLVASGFVISGNTIYDSELFGIYFSMTSGAWNTAKFSNIQVRDNTIHDCKAASIYLYSGIHDLVTYPSVYSTDLEVSGNTVYDCGTIAGDDGNHGGLSITGWAAPMIFNNTIRDCYVTGAGIQTAKNIGAQIMFNTISGIRAGTPTGSFQNGMPIDGNGIFFDNLTIGGMASGNHISDLVSTGNDGSGAGLSFWDCRDAKFVGNIVENCFRGVFYGKASEQNNHIINNTFIDCDVGITKVGADVMAGSVTVKNNLFINCATGLRDGTNPSVTADYNCLHGSGEAYSGISAGANDFSVNPQLDATYRPQATALKRAGANLGGKDFYGKQFYNPPNIGAVDDVTATPRYSLTNP